MSIFEKSEADSFNTAIRKLKDLYHRGMITDSEFESRASKILAEFRIPLKPGPPAPENAVDPGKHYIHPYHDCATVSIGFPGTSSRQELLEKAASDEPIKITNDLGLTAFIKHAVISEKGDLLKGEGFIEGYTVIGERPFPEITVFFNKDGSIRRLSYYETREDASEHLSYPLWQPYYEWVRQQPGILESLKKD